MGKSSNLASQIKSRIIVILLATLCFTGCGIVPHSYQAAPISGQVIDKDTGEPIEGVHVAVYWQLYDETAGIAGMGGRTATDVIGVSETVSGKDGFYHIPGWGPLYEAGDYLGGESPNIGFYKKGYQFRRVYNSTLELLETKNLISEDYKKNVRNKSQGDTYFSIWDGKQIKLERQSGDIEKRIENLKSAHRFIRNITAGNDCESKLIKNFILTYSDEVKEIVAVEPEKYRHSYFTNIDKYSDNNCGRIADTIEQ